MTEREFLIKGRIDKNGDINLDREQDLGFRDTQLTSLDERLIDSGIEMLIDYKNNYKKG